MKLYSRAIVFGFFLSILLMIILYALVFVAYPLDNWQLFWTRKIWGMPFIALAPSVTMVFGLSVGIGVSLYWSNRMTFLEETVDRLRKSQSLLDEHPYDDMAGLMEKIESLQSYMQEQTQRSQRLIKERTENQQEKIDQVISDERNRLARELHDSVSQELFAASMLVSALNASEKAKEGMLQKQLLQIETIIQQAQLEMRALLLHLRPIALKDKTLSEGMEQLLEELTAKVPLSITWNLEKVKVNKGVEDHLFRILQESISNTLRHAKADTLNVLLLNRDGFVILKIEDDGIGFDAKEEHSGAYGLLNMKERAGELGANFRIVSIPNEGTRLEVRVPIINEDGENND